MSFDWDAFDNEFGLDSISQEPTKEETRPYASERGLLGDIGSGVSRAGVSLLDMGVESAEWLTGKDFTLDERIDKAREEYDILKPDESEYYDDSIWGGLRPGAFTEGLMTSLGAAAPGAVTGGLVGSALGPAGTLVGSAIGGLGSALLGWGGSAAQERKEELMAKGWSEEDANEAAWRAFAIEGGTEAVAAGLDIVSGGSMKVVNQIVKQGVKKTAKEMLKLSGKDMLKTTAQIMGVENMTEQLQAFLGRREELRVGLAEGNLTANDVLETFITTSAQSLFFSAGAVGYNAKQKRAVRKALESNNAEAKAQAVELIGSNLEKQGDKEAADSWRTYGLSYVKNDLPIRLEDDFVGIGERIEGKNIEIGDLASPNPDIAQHAADKVLKQAGINEDGSIDSEAVAEKIDTARFIQKAQEDVKQDPTKKGQRLRELQERRQQKQNEKAEKQLGEVQGVRDPLEVLEEQFQAQRTPEDKKMEAEAMVEEATVQPAIPEVETKDAKESAQIFEEVGKTREEELVDIAEEAEVDMQIEEAEVKAFEDSVDKYVKSKNNRATIQDYFSSADANTKLEMFRLMQEIEADTNNVRKEEANVLQELSNLTDEQKEVVQELPEAEIIKAYETGEKRGEAGIATTATTMTPELEAIRKDELERAGLTEDDIQGQATAPEELTNAAQTPEAKALVNGDWTELRRLINESEFSNEDVIGEAILSMGDAASNNMDYIRTLTGEALEATKTQRVNAVSGAKKTDAITWEPGSGVEQKGVHKESGLSVEISKEGREKGWTIIVDGKIVETVKTKGEARKIAEEYVEPLSQEYIDSLSKRGTYNKAGKVVQKIQEQEKERSKVDQVTKEDTKEEVPKTIERTPEEKQRLIDEYNKRLAEGESFGALELKGRGGNVENIRNAKELLKNSLDTLETTDKWIRPLTQAILRTAGSKLAQIPVLPSQEGLGSYYSQGRIFLENTSAAVRLHEAIHAITVEEMRANEGLGKEVDKVFADVRSQFLSEEQIADLDSLKTSKEFRDQWASKENLKGENVGILYGLMNREEFLAQAFNDPQFRDALNNVPMKNKRGKLVTAWSQLKEVIKGAFKSLGFNIQPRQASALEKVFQLVDDLQQVDTQYTDKVDQSFGALSDTQLDQSIEKNITNKQPDEVTGKIKRYWESFEDQMSKTFQSTYEALKTINLGLAEKMRKADMAINVKAKLRADKADAFNKKYKKLSDRDKKLMNLYIFNPQDIYQRRLDQLAKDVDMVEEIKEVREILDEVYQEAYDQGVVSFDKEDKYFPRFVTDLTGLSGYLRKEKQWGQMEEAIAQAEEKEGRKLTETEKAQVVTSILVTGRNPHAIAKNPSALKARSVDTISAGMLEYYADAPASLSKYINEMTEKIEMSRMLGNTDAKNEVKRLQRLIKIYEERPTEALKKQIEKIEERMPTLEKAIENGVGAMVRDLKLDPDTENRAKDLIRARVNQVGANRLVSNIRTAGLLGSLTQVTTGIRQLSDNVWSMYDNGILPTLQAAIQVGSGKADIKENPFDYQAAIKEFNDSPAWIDRALSLSGIHLMDKTMKKVNMQATINNAKKVSYEKFSKKWEPIFGEETQQVYKDLQDGKMTDNVQYLLFSVLANFQPVALSEMPQRYLTGGNGRIFYMLKSYATKSSNNFYRESVQKMRNGDIKGGMKNLMHLGILFTLMNASTDWFIDWLNGKNPDFTDSMVDSLLTLSFTSRYDLDKSKREGLVEGYLGQMIIPTNIADLPYKDLVNLFSEDRKMTLNILKLVPGFGNMMYNRLDPGGKDKALKNTRKDIIEDIKAGNMDREAIREYNSKVRGKEGMSKIDARAIRNAKKEARDNPPILPDILSLLSPKEAGAATLDGKVVPDSYKTTSSYLTEDTKKFLKQEEGFRTSMYVPRVKDKKTGKLTYGNSGPTIASGFDLGQRSNLNAYTFTPKIKEKLKPYLGIKGDAAKKFVDANPLKLTESEADLINSEVKELEARKVRDKFNKNSKLDFESLPDPIKTMIISVAFQYGIEGIQGENGAPNWWKQVTNGQWKEAYNNLRNFGDTTPERRKREAALIRQVALKGN
jgi:GH24 family phage-related lysozyme (muramidase)